MHVLPILSLYVLISAVYGKGKTDDMKSEHHRSHADDQFVSITGAKLSKEDLELYKKQVEAHNKQVQDHSDYYNYEYDEYAYATDHTGQEEKLEDHSGQEEELEDHTGKEGGLEKELHSKGTNDTEKASNETCKICKMNEIDKQYRLNSIKYDILGKLGFAGLNFPNVTGKKIPKVPSMEVLLEQYDMQADSPYDRPEDYIDDFSGEVQKAFTISQPTPLHLEIDLTGAFYFDIPDSVKSRQIQNATLWIYLESNRGRRKGIFELYVYKINPSKKKTTRHTKTEIRYKKVHSYGWHGFEIGHQVHHWVRHEKENLGLVVKAYDRRGNNIVVTPSRDDEENEHVPMLEMSTVEHSQKRVKRSIPMICSETQVIIPCCRYPLRVDFVEFGWDWVIAPTGYQANYCSGECRHTHQDENAGAYLVQQSPITGNGPCCTPTKTYPLAMLYFDHSHTVLYTFMQKMIVGQCGCA